MRKQDPQYIVNLINQIVGRDVICIMALNSNKFNTVWDVYGQVGHKLVRALSQMNPETLVGIGFYSDHHATVGKPPIMRRQKLRTCFEGLDVKSAEIIGAFHGLSGRDLFEAVALITLLMVVVDLIRQPLYKSTEELNELEEIGRRLNHPSKSSLWRKMFNEFMLKEINSGRVEMRVF